MRGVKGSIAWAVVLALGGCMKPIKLDLRVQHAQPASVNLRLLKGEGAPNPLTCETPCLIQIAPQTSNEISLRAPGYYPAVFEVTYQGMMPAVRKGTATLVVPMVERPAPAPVKEE